MKLTLDREDLRREHDGVNTSQTKFEHFNDEAQAALRVIGRGTLYEYDRSSYNAIYPPKGEVSPVAALLAVLTDGMGMTDGADFATELEDLARFLEHQIYTRKAKFFRAKAAAIRQAIEQATAPKGD